MFKSRQEARPGVDVVVVGLVVVAQVKKKLFLGHPLSPKAPFYTFDDIKSLALLLNSKSRFISMLDIVAMTNPISSSQHLLIVSSSSIFFLPLCLTLILNASAGYTTGSSWCIRLTCLTLICEVFRYCLVQVWQNLRKRLSGWRPAIAFLQLFLFHSLLRLTSFLSQNRKLILKFRQWLLWPDSIVGLTDTE